MNQLWETICRAGAWYSNAIAFHVAVAAIVFCAACIIILALRDRPAFPRARTSPGSRSR